MSSPANVIVDFGISEHAQGSAAAYYVILTLLAELYVDDSSPNAYRSAFNMLAARGLAENHAVKAMRELFNRKVEA